MRKSLLKRYQPRHSTLDRVVEEPHPSQCHPRVMLSGEHAHEGTEETQYHRERAKN